MGLTVDQARRYREQQKQKEKMERTFKTSNKL